MYVDVFRTPFQDGKTFMANAKRREVAESVLNRNQRREAEINEASVESMSELLDELERVQEKIIALLRKIGLKPDVRVVALDDAIKEAEHDLDEYNALLTRYGRSGNG
jgi:hypothetical protein